jgi:hypothetical protein
MIMARRCSWSAAVVLLVTAASSSYAANQPAVCSDIQKQLGAPPYLLGLRLEDVLDDRNRRHIPNIDIDGDGLIDTVYWACPDQGSPTPADPCKLSVELSTGTKFDFEEYGFSLIQHKRAIYALSASMGRNRTPGDGKLWRIDGKGVRIVCTGL